MSIKYFKAMAFIFLMSMFSSSSLRSEEGMWTFDNLPTNTIQKKYGFLPTKKWLEHVRLSSIRINDGGSGSFVSPNGLLMTNLHVAISQIQKLSTPANNYVKNGFYAKHKHQELKCKDLEINVLVSMENVTKKVRAAVNEDMDIEEAQAAKRKILGELKKSTAEKSGFRADIVNLYYGGEYWIYSYKKYTDIRLVFCPEYQAGFYGGEMDNFTYPRYNLDVTFLRVYEEGKAIKSDHFFKWSKTGVNENELVFMAGNPGSTDRLFTHSQLKYARDHQLSTTISSLKSTLKAVRTYEAQSEENKRRAAVTIMTLENSLKAYEGRYKGLLDEELFTMHKEREADLIKAVQKKDKLEDEFGDAWEEIADLMEEKVELKNIAYHSLGRASMFRMGSVLLRLAKLQNKVLDKDVKAIDRLKRHILSGAPVYKDLDEVLFRTKLKHASSKLEDDDFLEMVLDGKTPNMVARNIIGRSQLDNMEYRKKLVEGGAASIDNCKDPVLEIIRKVRPMLTEEYKEYAENISSKLSVQSEKIAKARFAVYGKNVYPDANFTPRLTYGTVKSGLENGTMSPPFTTLYGLYNRSIGFNDKGLFKLPKRFVDRKNQLDLTTKCNFISTCDIIGGNSGSPTFNNRAEIVGIVFDGNMSSLPGSFVYDYSKNRALSVDSRYIIHALRKLYDAGTLADELTKN